MKDLSRILAVSWKKGKRKALKITSSHKQGICLKSLLQLVGVKQPLMRYTLVVSLTQKLLKKKKQQE
jgi:hypothetical protein